MDELLARLAEATEGSRELDAAIVAEMNNAAVRPYPPTDDFGPRDRWQFWSRDGAHFLGSESRFKVPPLTTSIDAALTLVPEGWYWDLSDKDGAHVMLAGDGFLGERGDVEIFGRGATPALSMVIAALRSRATLQKGE